MHVATSSGQLGNAPTGATETAGAPTGVTIDPAATGAVVSTTAGAAQPTQQISAEVASQDGSPQATSAVGQTMPLSGAMQNAPDLTGSVASAQAPRAVTVNTADSSSSSSSVAAGGLPAVDMSKVPTAQALRDMYAFNPPTADYTGYQPDIPYVAAGLLPGAAYPPGSIAASMISTAELQALGFTQGSSGTWYGPLYVGQKT